MSQSVVLFASTSHALLAEKVAVREGLAVKLIPVPRHLSSDCGLCLCFASVDRARLEALLAETAAPWTEIAEI